MSTAMRLLTAACALSGALGLVAPVARTASRVARASEPGPQTPTPEPEKPKPAPSPVIMPTVTGANGEQIDVVSRLLKDRILLLGSEVNDEVANVLVAQMLYLANEDRATSRSTSTRPAAPSLGGAQGQAADIEIQAKEILFTKACINTYMSDARGSVAIPAGIQFGDTGGAAIVLDDVAVRRGPVELLSGVSWRVLPGERWGIVGPNGAGKSTLLGAILGVHESTTGGIAVKEDASVGYLEQTGVGGSSSTVREEVMSRMGDLAAAQAELDAATAAVEGGDYWRRRRRMGTAQEDFEDKGGYTAEETVAKVLGGLGFDVKSDLDRPCGDFSGGWQMRIALARLLLSGPEMLLLDEPTNHLDSAARSWLATYLADYEGTLVLTYLKLPTPPECGKMPVELKGRPLGGRRVVGARAALRPPGGELFEDIGVDVKPIVRDANLAVERGMRIVVRGANGAGKSTLVKAVAGVAAHRWRRRCDDRLSLGFFRQDLSQELDQEATALEVVLRARGRTATR
ncbi:ATPase [Aureococcus anophagefferens]|nr:ATPase [Aureococcus anophagefferens]